MQKNIASQKWRVFAFDRTTNAPSTGGAANITAKISKDFGTANATNDTNPTEVEDGYYEFDLTQAETNANDLLILPESATANIVVVGCPARIATSPASWSDGVIQTGDSFARIGSNGASLTQVGIATASINAVADQVWNEAYADHTTAGTFGKLMDIIRKANLSVDGTVSGTPTVNTFNTDLSDATSTYNHQLLVFTSGALEGVLRPILSYTQTNGVIVLQEDLPSAPSASDEFTILVQHVHPISEIQSGLATSASLSNVESKIDAIDDYIDTEVAAIKAKTDNLPSDPADQSAVEAAITSATSGLATSSSLSSVEAKIDAIDDYLDTEVAAIKAKTDNLPADPADQSAVEAAITSATSGLATSSSLSSVEAKIDAIDDYLDTEVAAIKAKTDNLPSDPADASDIAASFSTVNSTLATIAAYIDTEIAAIKAKTDNLPSDPADQSAVEAAITTAQNAITAAMAALATATELAKVPKAGETRRYTQIASNSGSKTADVSIGNPL